MLPLGASTRVFVATAPVDMRGSFDALPGHVRRMHANPLDGALYIFLTAVRRGVERHSPWGSTKFRGCDLLLGRGVHHARAASH